MFDVVAISEAGIVRVVYSNIPTSKEAKSLAEHCRTQNFREGTVFHVRRIGG